MDWAAMQSATISELSLLIHYPSGGLRPYRINPKSGARYSVEGQKLKRMGVRPGVWDYLLPCPRWYGNELHTGLWIEMKAPGAKLSEEQEAWRGAMLGQGFAMFVAESWDAARLAILAYLNILASDKITLTTRH